MTLENQRVPVDEDFAAAFAEFSKAEDKPVETPAVEAPAVEAAPEAAPAAEAPAVEAAPEAEAPAVEAAPAAEAPKAAPSVDDILNRLDKIVAKPAEPEVKPAPAAEEERPLYSEEEEKILAAYEKDWTDVARGESLRRRAENAELVKFVFTEIAKTVLPLKEMTEAMATRTHYSDIESKIGKYDDSLRDQVESWIKGQPDYLQTAYMQVIDQGTSEQVADLVARFRTETGTATTPASPAPTKAVTELSTPAKQAADALAPVETKRTVIEQADDPNDFGAAFAKFSKMLDS